jgi:hypothetical protein
MATWADPSATWADPAVTWTGQGDTEPPDTGLNVRQLEDGYARLLENGDYRLLEGVTVSTDHRRTNFTGWYFDVQEDFQDVVDWAEGRGEPFYV